MGIVPSTVRVWAEFSTGACFVKNQVKSAAGREKIIKAGEIYVLRVQSMFMELML